MPADRERECEVTKTGEEQPLEEAFIAPPPEATAPEPAPAVTEAAAAPAPGAPEALPATASPFFAIGLGGLLTAAAGLTLRRLAYRKS